MPISNDAMMLLFYDFEGDTADHDDWHSNQHFLERLSVPGFLRATRWVATSGSPRYLVTYDVSTTDIATSQPYLDRLNAPTPWTREVMPRFRSMTRGFGNVVAGSGFGLGSMALVLRFFPKGDTADALADTLIRNVIPEIASMEGVVTSLLTRPIAASPMTKEQTLRGPDKLLPWVILVTAYDTEPLGCVAAAHFDQDQLCKSGASNDMVINQYALAHTATATDAAQQRKILD